MSLATLPFTWLRCDRCQVEMPATPEFFSARLLAGRLRRCLCLDCAAQDKRVAASVGLTSDPDPEAEHACTRCNALWPRTAEFFRPLGAGRLHHVCRACESEARRVRRAGDLQATPAAHKSDAIAPLLTGAHFFAGAQIGLVAPFCASTRPTHAPEATTAVLNASERLAGPLA